MAKNYLQKPILLLLLALLPILTYAQCPVGNIAFDTQAQIDQFLIDYPNCTTINGDLKVSGSVINLNGLKNITQITGQLYISNTFPLTDIGGLNNLESIGDNLTFHSCNSLTNLNGLNKLQTVGRRLQIYNMPLLANLDGLSQLQTVPELFSITDLPSLTNLNGLSKLQATGAFYITNVPLITNINGLSNLKSSKSIKISKLPLLTNINGLSELKSFNGNITIEDNLLLNNISGIKNITIGITDLIIKDNPALGVCDLPNLCTYLSKSTITHPRTISGNLANCINEAAVATVCSACPTENVTFTTQTEVDQFLIDYPNCTKINGNLGINGTIANLNGLKNITQIIGNLNISNAPSLTDISGLSNLESVGGDFEIDNNPLLTNFDGLSKLKTVAGSFGFGNLPLLNNINGLNKLESIGAMFGVMNAPLLSNVNGLSNLKTIGGDFVFMIMPLLSNVNGLSKLESIGGNFGFQNNAVLTNIDGLSSLKSIGGNFALLNIAKLTNLDGLNNVISISGTLVIKDNALLSNISGIKNITTGIRNLIIKDNPALAVCDLPNLCTYISKPANTHPREISGNKTNCISEAAIITACGTSACPTGNVVLKTQAEVDQFLIDYPTCTQISGLLDIGVWGNLTSSNITNLNGLANINKVTGSVRIGYNPLLTDITGLGNLTNIIGYLTISYNNALTNINGLSKLKTITNNLAITNNTKLANINALSSLETVGGFLEIQDNALLTSISGLSSLKSVNGQFKIINNPVLTNLNGLNKLESIGGSLEITNNAALTGISSLEKIATGIRNLIIRNNPALAVCDLPNFCTYLSTSTNQRNISGNKAECIEAAVLSACFPPVCPTGNLTLASQAQINTFATTYPNCTEIAGNLFIGVSEGTSDITDLSPLNKIETITGDFNIERSALTSINGLNNLSTINGHAYIGLNPSLTQINNLNNLTNIDGSLNITNNPLLSSLSGLNKLTNVGSFLKIWDNTALNNIDGLNKLITIGGTLTIINNSSLANLNGLSSLTTIAGSLIIQENTLMTNISGLRNINTGILDLTIVDNPALAVCNLPNFCTYLANPNDTHSRDISGNLDLCLNEQAINAACSTVLPITLSRYNIITNNNYVLLQWKIESEDAYKGFVIYRSGNDGIFVKIGNIEPSESKDITYSFTDKQPLNGSNYYKLIQIDKDGKETELGVRTANFGLPTTNIQLSPNPTINEVTVNWGNISVSSIKLTDLSGKLLQVIKPSLSTKSININLTNYPSGTYVLRIIYSDGIETKKLVKL